jgi:hypothetical protein
MPYDEGIILTPHCGSLAPERGEGSRVRGEIAAINIFAAFLKQF